MSMDTDRKLKELFSYQEFKQDKELEVLMNEAQLNYGVALSDFELSLVLGGTGEDKLVNFSDVACDDNFVPKSESDKICGNCEFCYMVNGKYYCSKK